MAKNRWLLIDVDGLAHRAWHIAAFQEFKHKGMPTGVIYGLLRDIVGLQEQFATRHIAFCFDHGRSFRSVVYPDYKANRTREGKEALYQQLHLLKVSILREIGFTNIFFQEGFEADDWLAVLSRKLLKLSSCVLVTRDHDMHQLLTKDNRVACWDSQAKRTITYETVVFGNSRVCPDDLPKLMALTGCKTDNIQGVPGVGPETAIKILKKEPVSEKIWNLLLEHGKTVDFNLKLVTLPWPGLEPTDRPSIKTDTVTQEKWNAACRKFGIESLIPRCPVVSP